ncbi:MAG: hypothetical protein ACI4SG_09375 [Oligosphaeraceae bacterium]
MKPLPCLLWFLFALVAPVLSALEAVPETYLRLPPMPRPPVIDGRSDPQEWAMASPTFGAYSRQTGMLSRREVSHFIGYDSAYLFIAQRSELPPPPMTLSPRDAIVVSFGQETMTSLIFPWNNLDSVDGVVVQSTQHHGVWDFEAAIPWRAFGLEGVQEGREYRLQIVRRFQNLPEEATWSWGEAGIFVPRSGVPVAGFKTFGNRWKTAGYDIQWSVANPGDAPAEADLSALMVSIEPPSHLDTRLSPAPGQEVTGTLRAILTPLDRTIHSTITDAADGQLLYRRNFSWHAGDGVAYVDPDPPYVLDMGLYPTKGVVKARITCSSQEKLKALRDVSFQITGENGTLHSQEHARNFQARWALPPLPPGKYTLTATLKDARGDLPVLAREFAIQDFPWQGRNIGVDRLVLPPYVPLTYDNRTVTGLQTAYRLGASLWDSIQVPGGELLARPVQLTLDGKPARLQLPGAFPGMSPGQRPAGRRRLPLHPPLHHRLESPAPHRPPGALVRLFPRPLRSQSHPLPAHGCRQTAQGMDAEAPPSLPPGPCPRLRLE